MRRTLYILFVLSCSIVLISCSNESTVIQNEELADNEEVSKEADIVADEPEEEVIPEESQQITQFPWDEDADFKSTQEANDTDVLIAGFITVFENSTQEERDNINLAVSTISGTVIKPGEVFSQNETAGPYTEERGYKEGIGYVGGEPVKDFGGGVCNVATTLYNTSILSNLDIIERHNHSMPVPYVPYGQDAAVAYGYKDFQFKNSTEDPILIWAELVDNRIYMAFYGKEEAPEITWEHETLSETETTTEYRVNPDLSTGEENVLVHGMDGKVVNSILKIKDKNGEEQIVDLGNSSYNPLKNLIEVSE